MPLVLGLDLGTTTLTALALDSETGRQEARVTEPVPAAAALPAPAPAEHPCSEWDAGAIAAAALLCLRQLAEQVGARRDLAGLALTGQQHGVVLVDEAVRPLGPFVNWRDRRGEHPFPGAARTWTEAARLRLGEGAPAVAGCKLHTGYMGLTLFWLAEQGLLPPAGTACFLVDYVTALLTGLPPVTDATCAASSGLLDVRRGDWADDLLVALGLPRVLFPQVRPSGERRGGLTEGVAQITGLPAGLPVMVGVGDNQASFLGSAGRAAGTLLVNVGTGGQVAAFTPTFAYDAELETRPFPGGGFLLVSAGLVGGAAYAALERFFRAVLRDLAGAEPAGAVFDAMNRLAAAVGPGADGLRCEPFFDGTRLRPEVRASFSGLSSANYTPGHLARALLEGVARTFAASAAAIARVCPEDRPRLVGAGNGIRDNAVLARIIAETFGRPLEVAAHREEAATGAALLAGVGAGVFADLAAVGGLIRHEVVR
jgi:sugar (pentulose or hexulose) kinase